MSFILGHEVFEVGFGVFDASNLIFVVDEVSKRNEYASQILNESSRLPQGLQVSSINRVSGKT